MNAPHDLNHWLNLLAEAGPAALDAVVKSVLLLALAALATGAMRRCSAAARHLVWLLAVAGLFALPALSWTLPGWNILPRWMSVKPVAAVAAEKAAAGAQGQAQSGAQADGTYGTYGTYMTYRTDPTDPSDRPGRPTPSAERMGNMLAATSPAAPARIVPGRAHGALRARFSAGELLLAAWLAGFAFVFLRTATGMAGLWRLERGSRVERAPSWLELLRQLARGLGLGRPVALLKSHRRRMPMTWGVMRPRLLLPEASEAWPEERRRVVLLHELAHAWRWDYATNLVTRLACAIWWFNPLVWLAARQMAAERERACDDIVLNHGAKPAEYAEQLLEIAAGLRPGGWTECAGIAMARPTKLEGRLRAILDAKRNRAALTRAAVFAALLVLTAVLIPVAMMKAAPLEGTANPNNGGGLNWPQLRQAQSVGPTPAVSTSAATNGGASSNDIAAIVDKLLNARGKVDWVPMVEQIAAYGDRAVPIISNRLADEKAAGDFKFALVSSLCKIGTEASLKPVRDILQDTARDQELIPTSRPLNEAGTRNLYWELTEAIKEYPTNRDVDILPQVIHYSDPSFAGISFDAKERLTAMIHRQPSVIGVIIAALDDDRDGFSAGLADIINRELGNPFRWPPGSGAPRSYVALRNSFWLDWWERNKDHYKSIDETEAEAAGVSNSFPVLFTPRARSGWGEQANGLRTRLVAENHEYRAGEPIRMRIEITNTSGQTVHFVAPVAPYLNSLLVLDAGGKAVAYIGGGGLIPNALGGGDLAPGQSLLFQRFDLADFYYLRAPGSYTVQLPAVPNPPQSTFVPTVVVGLPLSGKFAFEVVSNPQSDWGEPVEGFQVRLRAASDAGAGEAWPRLLVDITNQGPRGVGSTTNSFTWQLQVDGHWYISKDNERRAAMSLHVMPGQAWTNLPLDMDSPWRLAGPEEVTTQMFSSWAMTYPDNPLMKLPPGKHTVRVAVVAGPIFAGDGGAVRAVSNPVEVGVPTTAPSTAAPARVPKSPEAILAELRNILPEDWTCQLILKPGGTEATLPLVNEPLFEIDFTNFNISLAKYDFGSWPPPPHPFLRLYFVPAAEKAWVQRGTNGIWNISRLATIAVAETPDYLAVTSFRNINDAGFGTVLRQSIAPLGFALEKYFGKLADKDAGDVLGMTAESAEGLTTGSGFAGQVVDDQTGKPVNVFIVEYDEREPLTAATNRASGFVFYGGRFMLQFQLTNSAWDQVQFSGEDSRLVNHTEWTTGQKLQLQVRADGYLPAPLTPEPVVWPVKLTNLLVRLKRELAQTPDRAQTIPLAIGATNRAGLTDSAPGHLSGRVLKPSGEPAVGALVRVVCAKDQETTDQQTDAAGKFEVEWTRMSATQPYMLVVRDVADNLGAMEDLDEAGDPIEIKLEPGLDLVVRTESRNAHVTNADLLLTCRVGNSSMRMPGLSLKTNKPGEYEIRGLVPGKPYGLIVTAPGFGRRSFYQLPPSPAGQEVHPVELEPADQIVAGQVVDLGGAPVPNVQLSLSGPEQVSLTNMADTEGKFVFEHLVKTNYLILANAPPIRDGGARSLAQIDPISLGQFAANPPTSGAVSANGGDTNVILRLGESNDDHTGRSLMKLTGVIRGPDGKPAAGAAVMLFPESFAGSLGVRADRNGGYQIFWRHLYVNVNRGYVIARDLSRNLAVAGDFYLDVTNLDAQLKPAVTLSGTVREKNGGPMAGAQVKLWVKIGNADDPLDGLTLATDAQGNYEFKGLPADLQYTLAAGAKDHGRTLQPVNTEGASGRLEIAPIEIEPANSLVAGKVLDENDKPVAGATVSFSALGQYGQQITTDSAGAFQFNVIEGTVQIQVNGQFRGVPAQSGDTNVILRIGQIQAGGNRSQGHELKGRVTGPDGKPAPRASVQLYPSFGAAQSARTGADGQYQLEWPPIADGRDRLLLVRDVNHNLAAFRELTGEVSNLNVRLLPAITVRGHVQGDDGKPVFNASLSVALGSGAAQQPLYDLTAASDSFGNYEIKALPEGRQCQICVSASKFGSKQLEVRAAAQGASNVLNLKPIVLRVANLVVAGRVVDEDNKPVSGVAVYSRGSDQPNDYATSDSEGRFSLNVCSGQVIVCSYGLHAWQLQGQVAAKAGDTNLVLTVHR